MVVASLILLFTLIAVATLGLVLFIILSILADGWEDITHDR